MYLGWKSFWKYELWSSTPILQNLVSILLNPKLLQEGCVIIKDWNNNRIFTEKKGNLMIWCMFEHWCIDFWWFLMTKFCSKVEKTFFSALVRKVLLSARLGVRKVIFFHLYWKILYATWRKVFLHSCRCIPRLRLGLQTRHSSRKLTFRSVA